MKRLAIALLATTMAGQMATAAPPSSPHPPAGREYGRRLEIKGLGIGPMMSVTAAGKYLYAIGSGRLFVLDNSQPDQPRVVGQLAGLGEVRQIAIQGSVAYITSREDGLFLVDVRQPDRPRLLSHYDTIELATGIAVSGDVAAVANRNPGVEFVDVSDPKHPRHLSTVRVGEAQSVVFQGEYLYAGIWGSREMAVIDVHNARRPKLVALAPLDGQGDGVAVRGNLAFMVTGHHSRAKPAAKPGDPGFGRGHGLEVFDISNPREPRFMSRLKLPQLYRLGMDMWGVVLAGDYAFVHDTYNGMFMIDIRDPVRPKCVANRQLPIVAGRNDPSPLAGLAVVGDRVYLAGAWSDLHVAATGVTVTADSQVGAGLKVPPEELATADPYCRVYRVDGQVHAVLPWREEPKGSLLLVAAGTAGVHVVRLGSQIERVAEYPTRGFATDVAFYGDTVYVAEANSGLSIWKRQPSGELVRTGEYKVPGRSIRQVVLAAKGTIAFLAVGGDCLQAVQLSGADSPKPLLSEQHLGLFYRLPISPTAANDRSIMCQWHVTGLYEYEATSEGVRFTGYQYPYKIGSLCGAVAVDDRWVATVRHGYIELPPSGSRSPEEIKPITIAGADLSGKPSVGGHVLFTAHIYDGPVSAVDITDIRHPKMLASLKLSEHPAFVRLHQEIALVPAGYQGLVAWDFHAASKEQSAAEKRK